MLDPLSLVKGLLHVLTGQHRDAMLHYLLRGKRTTKGSCRQNEGFGDGIIALHIIGWVSFGIALCLCLRESFGIVMTHGHRTEDGVHRAVEDASDGTDPGSCHPLAHGAEHRR